MKNKELLTIVVFVDNVQLGLWRREEEEVRGSPSNLSILISDNN